MLRSIALPALRAAALRSPTARAAATLHASRAVRCLSATSEGYAVDGPDGAHDLQDVVESNDWARRVIEVAAVKEDAASINEMHDAVLGKTLFAVDSPDGEHDLEDVEEHMDGVNKIINQASLFEDPATVKEQQHLRQECRERASTMTEHDVGYPP